MKDSTVSSDLAFPNPAHHGDVFLVGLRSPADLGTCLFTGDLTHSLLDLKLNTHGDVAAKQVYGIHVRASYSLENKIKNGQNMAMLDVLAGEMAGAEVGNQLP